MDSIFILRNLDGGNRSVSNASLKAYSSAKRIRFSQVLPEIEKNKKSNKSRKSCLKLVVLKQESIPMKPCS
jgi:hypothetical protein